MVISLYNLYLFLSTNAPNLSTSLIFEPLDGAGNTMTIFKIIINLLFYVICFSLYNKITINGIIS